MADRIRKINVSTRDTAHVVIGNKLAPGARIQAIDIALNGTIYAADFFNHVIYKIFEDGRVEGVVIGDIGTAGDVNSTGVGASTGLVARADQPLGLCVDSSENIYVGSDSGLLIRRMSPSGRWQVFAGKYATSGNVVSPLDSLAVAGEDARFGVHALGMGMSVDMAGIIYLADTGNNRIKKLWASGKSTSLAGSTAGFANATGESARFNGPRDVAVDARGTVYVADTLNNRIRKITEDGVVTTLAGATAPGFVDGDGLTARFNAPTRLALDPSGRNLFVLDRGNSAVRRVDQHGQVHTFMPYNPPATHMGDIAIDKSGFVYVLENNV